MANKKAEEEVLEQLDPRDAEIAKLKEELEKAQRRAVFSSPKQEQARIRQLAEQAEDAGEDPWDVKVEVRIPKRPATEDPWYWININNRSVQIPANDKLQELKLPWAIALLDMLAAEDKTQDYIDEEMHDNHQLGGSPDTKS